MISNMLNQTITIAHVSSKDDHGDPTYATAATAAANVENSDKVVTFEGGEERQAQYKIATQTEIKFGDRIWLPGEATTDEPHRPMVISKAVSVVDGVSLWEAYL